MHVASIGARATGSVHAYHFEESRRLCYLLLKPDAFLRRVAGGVLGHFEQAGFELLDFCYGRLSRSQYQLMYARDFKWSVDLWEHNANAYQFGPVIGVLFLAPTSYSDARPAQETIASWKGHTLPSRASPETIRGRFSATSRVFNIVHIPVDIEQAIREACMWFGAETARSLLDRYVHTRSSSNTEGNRYVSAISMYEEHGYAYDRCVVSESSFAFLKARLMHAISKRLRSQEDERSSLQYLERHYQTMAHSLLSKSMGHDERRSLVASAAGNEEEHLRILRNLNDFISSSGYGVFNRDVVDLLLALNSRPRNVSPYLQYFQELLDDWRVYRSDLEQYMVSTLFIYPDA